MKTEACARTTLTLTPALADLGLQGSTAKPTSLTALKGDGLNQADIFLYFYCHTYTPTTYIDTEYQIFVKFKSFYPILLMSTVHALMEGHALTKSMATHAPAALASLGPTASMRSMNVIPSPASMGASVKMLLIPSDVPAPKGFSAIAVRYTQTLICQAFVTLCTFTCLNVAFF